MQTATENTEDTEKYILVGVHLRNLRLFSSSLFSVPSVAEHFFSITCGQMIYSLPANPPPKWR